MDIYARGRSAVESWGCTCLGSLNRDKFCTYDDQVYSTICIITCTYLQTKSSTCIATFTRCRLVVLTFSSIDLIQKVCVNHMATVPDVYLHHQFAKLSRWNPSRFQKSCHLVGSRGGDLSKSDEGCSLATFDLDLLILGFQITVPLSE